MKKTKTELTMLLGLVAAIAALVGCGAAPASQTAEVARTSEAAKATAGQETSPNTAAKMFQADSLPPKAAGESAKNEPAAAPVEVGYKIGMHAPEFGMSLLDGTRVTQQSIVNEGKPVFIYFHATW